MLVFWMLWAGSIAGWGPQETSYPLDEAIEVWVERAGQNPAYLAERGTEFFTAGQEGRSCDSTLLGYALLLEAHLADPATYERPEHDALACPLVGARIAQSEGTVAYHNGQFDLAQNWFERALNATSDPSLRASLMQSLGSSAYMMSDLQAALKWYAASTEYGLELLSSISLNNLSNVNLALNDPKETLKWGSLAEQRLIEEFADGLSIATFEKRRDLILLNLCLAALALDDMEALQGYYARMTLKDFFPGMAIEFLFAANMFAWRLDDPYPVSLHAEAFSAHVLIDSVSAVERLGPMLILIEPWRSAWEAEQGAPSSPWPVLRALPHSDLPDISHNMEIEPENELTPLLFGWGLGGAVLLMGLTAAWRLGGFRRHRNDLAADQVEALRAMLHADGSQATSSVDRMLEAIHRTVSLQLARQLNAQFTHRELEVLRGVAQGERAKDTAERLGVGSKSIYMTRTEIRKKLGLHSTDRLEDWLSELSKSTTAP